MRKIGIDARLYSQTGVGVYMRNLLYFLQKNADKDINYYIYLMDEDNTKITFTDHRFIKRKANYPWHSFSEQAGFLKTINRDGLDLMHFTYFSYPLFYRKPFIVTIHDLTPLLFKTGRASTKNPIIYSFKHTVFKYILSSQMKNAKAIITPTKTVKRQLIDVYGEKYKNKIHQIYEGVNYELIEAKENHDLKKKFSKPFFIYIGNFYPHKNLENLIKAFSKIQKDIQLILIGPKDYFSTRLLQFNIKLEQNERIKFFHSSKLEDLVFFYKNALALIHPSLSEGFGLPIIEAAYFNCPIIASNIDVFKEILDDNYLSFNPYSVDYMKKQIEYFLEKKPKYDYKDFVNKYSFEKMTEKTIKIYLNASDK